jgi:hydrogenase/urease accessory protein HupE
MSLYFVPVSVQADQIRPAYLEISELTQDTWDLLWKVPAKGDKRQALHVKFPTTCTEGTRGSRFVGNAYVERWRLICDEGLIGQEVHISGLAESRTDVLVRVLRAEGIEQTFRLTPSKSTFVIKPDESLLAVSTTYLVLGFEHILSGFDHLLFVLALLFLVGSWPRLIGTITMFTVAHSITLVSASFGWVSMPQTPIEVLIVLSIVFVAVEIVHARRGKHSIAIRMPWVIAFAFGLLHGFGFAGALSEIGLPQHAIPLALLFFNVGVEFGQLAFVAAVFGLLFICKLAIRRSSPAFNIWGMIAATSLPAAYLIGTLAMFWVLERTYNFLV